MSFSWNQLNFIETEKQNRKIENKSRQNMRCDDGVAADPELQFSIERTAKQKSHLYIVYKFNVPQNIRANSSDFRRRTVRTDTRNCQVWTMDFSAEIEIDHSNKSKFGRCEFAGITYLACHKRKQNSLTISVNSVSSVCVFVIDTL